MPAWLSELAEELRDIDRRRRVRGGLSLADAARYRDLISRLGHILGTRSSPTDQREFLRVPHPVTILFHAGGELRAGMASDFGGGGMSLSSAHHLSVGDRIVLERAMAGDGWLRLHGEAEVVWRTACGGLGESSVGVAFQAASAEMREQIDRVFYRVLDLYFAASSERLADLRGETELDSMPVAELCGGVELLTERGSELVETLRRTAHGE